MPKKNLTEIGLILDRSGSMQSIRDDAIGGFNSFLEAQQKEDGEAVLTVVQFDYYQLKTHDATPIQNVEKLNTNTFVPRGNTALYDAIGETIISIGERLANTPEDERPENVIIAILTDGQDNASAKYSQAQINTMITHQQSKYNWNFIYLAAGQDAFANAGNIGISQLNTMQYDANARGITTTYNSMNSAVSMLRKGTLSASWKEETTNNGVD